MTRISSFHQYDAIANDMMRQQQKLQKNHDELSSAKRVLTAGADPLGSINIQNFKQQNTQIEQYLAAINLARNRQNAAEITISQLETLLDEAKNTGLKIINGALSDNDRKAYQQVLQSLYDEFLDLANGKDESGNFVFSGTLASSQPFFRNETGQVAYLGNSFYRSATIAPSIDIQTSYAGDNVFMQVNNPFGDYLPKYALATKSSLLLTEAFNANKADNASYQLNFTHDNTGKLEYDLLQNGTSVSKGAYDPNAGIIWNDLSVKLQGRIQKGDSVLLEKQSHFSLFDLYKNAIDLAVKAPTDTSATAELQKTIKQLSAAFIHMNQVRSEVGVRLNALDRQEDIHKDYQVVLSRSLSTIEDLDYSKAVIDMNENLLALEASQKAFAKTKELSLFNYI